MQGGGYRWTAAPDHCWNGIDHATEMFAMPPGPSPAQYPSTYCMQLAPKYLPQAKPASCGRKPKPGIPVSVCACAVW